MEDKSNQTSQLGVTLLEFDGKYDSPHRCEDLIAKYDSVSRLDRIHWSTNLRLIREIGRGGQGTVFLAERVGADGFNLPVAVKVFSPEPYLRPEDYDQDMRRVAKIASKVAAIQNEHLLSVNHFLDRNRIRVMIMERIEGYDLRKLLTPKMLGIVQDRVSEKRWTRIQKNLVCPGREQPKLNPIQALFVIQGCLAGLKSMHEHGLVHGDVKPANIMINRCGSAKLIDIGSAADETVPAKFKACTPAYAAPEVLDGQSPTMSSDLVSLGYVFMELVAGKPLFRNVDDLAKLSDEKRHVASALIDLFGEIEKNTDELVAVCMELVTAADEYDAANRITNLIDETGLLANRQNELPIWLEELLEIEQSD